MLFNVPHNVIGSCSNRLPTLPLYIESRNMTLAKYLYLQAGLVVRQTPRNSLPSIAALSHRIKRPILGSTFVPARFYTPGNVPKTPPVLKPPSEHSAVVKGAPAPRHEVREGNAAINIPLNPPGGGSGPGIGGSGSVFPLTSSPLLDAALTTIVGLGLGK